MGKAKQREMQAMRAAGMTLASAERLAQARSGSPVALIAIGGLALVTMAGIGVLSLNLPTATDAAQTVVDVAPVPIPTRQPEIAPDTDVANLTTSSSAVDAAEVVPVPQPVTQELPWVTALEQSNPGPAPTVATPAVVQTDCVASLAAEISGVLIQFDAGSAAVPPDSFDRLSVVGTLINACPGARVQVAGHSDSSGSDLANLQLSWARAENTIEAFSILGFDTRQFETVGFGSRAPLQQGSSSDDDVNRRVELRVLKGETK